MKKSTIALLTGAALLAAAGIASATDVNLYGSSAQYPYWSAQAKQWLTKSTTNGGLGCTGTTNEYGATSPGMANGVTGVYCYAVQGTGCTSSLVDSTHTVNFRYCANASATGPQSVGGSNGDVDGCGDAYKRIMINPDATGTASCNTVLGGIADVQGEAFVQQSQGNKVGPMGGAVVNPIMSGVATNGLTQNTTVVVPFGFFVNKAVTATQCTAGLVGNYCKDEPGNTGNSQCDTAPGKGDGVCNSTPTTITNITRLQAAMLFSGQVADWSQFGAYYTAQPVVLCYRHAGSGTHATLDLTVMSAGATGWGASLPVAEDQIGPPVIWFNNSTGDMMNCVNGANSVISAGANNYYGTAHSTTNGGLVGAIGYADGDVSLSSLTNVAQVKYDGYYPTRTHIRNGEYEFYAPSQLYYNNNHNPGSTNIMKNLVTFAQQPGNVPSTKTNYWAALSEMNFVKGTDFAYPGFVGGGTQLP